MRYRLFSRREAFCFEKPKNDCGTSVLIEGLGEPIRRWKDDRTLDITVIETYWFPAWTIWCKRCLSLSSISRNSMPNSLAFAHLIAA